MPHAAAEFRPTLFQFVLVIASLPQSNEPVRSFQATHAAAAEAETATKAAATAAAFAFDLPAVAAAIAHHAAIAHSEVEVPRRTQGHFTFLEFLAVLASLIFGLVQEEAAPVGVAVVGDFLV